ncbi:MAG: polysaccharide deacetylase family protein [Bacillota bacterium]
MAKKTIIIVMSMILALVVGSGLGYGYYYLNYSSNVASANPLEKSDPAAPPAPVEQQEGNQGEFPGGKEAEPGINDEQEVNGETQTNNQGAGQPESTGKGETEGQLIVGGNEVPDNEEGKIVYLTFDDGPDPDNTPAVLEILEDYGIKATFFVLGVNAEKHPELIQQIYQGGHVVGNHTWNHVEKDTYGSDESFWDSVKKTEDLVYDIVGERIKLIREPYGRFLTNTKKQKMIREEGYGLLHWNVDSYDSRSPIPDAETIFENVKRQAAKERLWPSMVVLIHDGGNHGTSVEALPKIIEYLLDQGFVFKTGEEMDVEAMANLPKP